MTYTRLTANGPETRVPRLSGPKLKSSRCGLLINNPAMIKTKINPNFKKVAPFWNNSSVRRPKRCTAVIIQTTTREMTTGENPGVNTLKYSPNAIPAKAMGAGNPTTAEIHPARKRIDGGYILERYLYSPPDRGSAVANSE